LVDDDDGGTAALSFLSNSKIRKKATTTLDSSLPTAEQLKTG
jgi:hypothetical protein